MRTDVLVVLRVYAGAGVLAAGLVGCSHGEGGGFAMPPANRAGPLDGGTELETGVFGDGGPGCSAQCTPDETHVVDCAGNVVATCAANQRCGAGTCMAPCDAAVANKSSVGCEYFANALAAEGQGFGGCFVAFIANTWTAPVHIQATWNGQAIDLGTFAKVPKGTGLGITYGTYDPTNGLPPDEVAILFFSNDPVQHGSDKPPVACPVPAALGLDAQIHDGNRLETGRGHAFHITTDAPVVSYQMMPFGGGSAATTGATLLLPTSAWDSNYVGATAFHVASVGGVTIPPTMAIVAKDDGTQVTILPTQPIAQGLGGVQGAPANQPVTYTMQAGTSIEFMQNEDLTGSPITSNKPISVFAAHMGMQVPFDQAWVDHAEQQLAPVRALGSEYPAVSYRDRMPGHAEHRLWRIVGAVDGTALTFEPTVSGAPAAASLGSVAEFESDDPFVVRSQDAQHPFMLFTYMSGSTTISSDILHDGYGDPDFVRIVPGLQFLSRYVFFTDPTYPETNLVVVRRRGDNGFSDVTLDCAGTLGGFQPVGSGVDYEFTRVDLSRHNFEAQGNCNNGRHEMTSDQPFGLYVWGWGSGETRPNTTQPCDDTQRDNSCDVSYGYPAGENVSPINAVVVPPVPK
jgi:hypothetical protein